MKIFQELKKKIFLNNFHFFLAKWILVQIPRQIQATFHFDFCEMEWAQATQAVPTYMEFGFLRNGMGPGHPGSAYIYENQPSKTPILNYLCKTKMSNQFVESLQLQEEQDCLKVTHTFF